MKLLRSVLFLLAGCVLIGRIAVTWVDSTPTEMISSLPEDASQESQGEDDMEDSFDEDALVAPSIMPALYSASTRFMLAFVIPDYDRAAEIVVPPPQG